MNNQILEISLLRFLVAFAEEGNASQAARKLGLSQPSASHALKKLRKFFDDPLLVRAGKGMVPTPRSKELALDAAEILQGLQRLGMPKGQFDPAGFDGQFVVSAPEYLEHLLCPVLIAELQKVSPKSHLLVRPPDPERADKLLESGAIDLRLGFVGDPSADMRSRALYTERFVCLMRRGHPAARNEFTLERYAELRHVRLQVSQPSTASRMIDHAVRAIGGTVDVALVSPSYLTIGRVVATSDLVVTVPIGIAKSLLAHLPLQAVSTPVQIPPLKAAMYWHERFQSDSRHKWLRKLVAAASATALKEVG